MNRNDQISIAWYEAGLRAGPPVSEATVPAVSTSDLCARYASINLPNVLQQHVEEDEGNFVINLGSWDGLQTSTCSLCCLFGSVAPSGLKEPYGTYRNCQLRAFSAAKVQRADSGGLVFGISRLDVTMLGVVHEDDGKDLFPLFLGMEADLEETGFLCPIQNDRSAPHSGVRILTEGLDVDFVKRCISHCQDNHGLTEGCRVNDNPTRMGKAVQQESSMFQTQHQKHRPHTPRNNLSEQFFRLIDCTERAVVEAPTGSSYIALSYVWGASKDDSPNVPDSAVQWPPALVNLPKTIDDCIEATLSFGLKYLWIDRYCINQSNSVEQNNQVSQMDLIYANAELTIIAAAGSGPDFGLPGVNKTKRLPQPTLKIDAITLVSTLPSPRWSLQRSTWASRGWTYQEGLLSKRRLIFTPQQTYFECNGMHIGESALMPLDVMHLRQDDEDGDITAGAFDFSNPGSSPNHLQYMIAEYSGKFLTYPQDILNAMQGIFQHFGKLDPPVDHLMGIPMVSSVTATTYLPTNCFLAGLSWQLYNSGTRRAGFPSWTWAGWFGRIESSWLLENSSAVGSDMHVSLERPDGSLSSIFSEQRGTRVAGLNINFIHIESRTFTFQLILLKLIWYTAETDLGDLGTIYHRFESDRTLDQLEKEVYPKTLTAIVIGNPADIKLRDTMILCVEERGSFAERVGTFSLPWSPLSESSQAIEKPATLDQFASFLQRQPKRTIRLG